MIRQQVLEPDSDQAEREQLQEAIEMLTTAHAAGDPTGMIERALERLRAQLSTIEQRPHRGLVDYDPRLHG